MAFEAEINALNAQIITALTGKTITQCVWVPADQCYQIVLDTGAHFNVSIETMILSILDN